MFFVALKGYSQVISFDDANFKAKLIAASAGNTTAKNLSGIYFKIDANSNGEIEFAEAQQVKELKISFDSSIHSIVGILNFTNLEVLDAGFSGLTSLNISGLVTLKKLDCTNCPLHNNLDMTGCTALETVNCAAIQASNLDFTTLSNLKYLDCNTNSLTSLDLHNNTMLQTINCTTPGVNATLSYINIQNNSIETNINFPCLTSATNICCDPGDLNRVYAERQGCSLTNTFTVSTTCNLSTDDFRNNVFGVYPNPADGLITIATLETITKIEIYDSQHRMVKMGNLVNNAADVSGLSPGVYLAKVYTNDSSVSIRFIKR